MKNWLKLAFAAETVVTAAILGAVSYFVIYLGLAGGHRLEAYAYNMLFIAIVLLLDKGAGYIMEKEDFLMEDRGRVKNLLARLLFIGHFVSFKTALYLFYLAMLVVSRVSILDPDIIDRHGLRITFIHSVEYGILLLIPLDKFVELLTKDDKRLHKIMKHIGWEKEEEDTPQE